MLAGGVVAVLGHSAQPVEDLDVSLLKLGGAAPDQLLQDAADLVDPEAHEAGLEERADVGREDLEVYGLGQEVVRACLQGLKAGLRLGQTTDHEHGQEGVFVQPLAEIAQEVVPGHDGHVDVEDDEVWSDGVELGQRLRGIGEPLRRGVAGVLQRAGQQADDAGLVIDYQYACVRVYRLGHVAAPVCLCAAGPRLTWLQASLRHVRTLSVNSSAVKGFSR